MIYDPWRDAAQRHPDVHIERCDCQPFRGAWVPDERVILLDRSLLRAERNEVLAHEIAHLDLGHRPTGRAWFDKRQEKQADDLAATRLLPLEELAEVISAGALGSDEVALALDIPTKVVTRRVRRLTDAERTYIEDQIEAKGEVA